MSTKHRERFADVGDVGDLRFGELHYSSLILPPFAKRPIPGHLFFFGANIGPWESGQMVGDPSAVTGP